MLTPSILLWLQRTKASTALEEEASTSVDCFDTSEAKEKVTVPAKEVT